MSDNDHPKSASSDAVIRVMTDDHAFRVIAADTTHTVRDIARAQHVDTRIARPLGELITATILLRETMAPNLRVQGIAKGGGGKGSLVADSHPDGTTRGLVQLRREAGGVFNIGRGALLQMMRSLPNGAIHQGLVDLGGSGNISKALMLYMQESEQVVGVAAVGVRISDDDVVIKAGGYIVQLLPEAERPAHMIMTERLDDFPSLDTLFDRPEFGADMLVSELLFGMPHTLLGRSELRYACHCTKDTVLTALLSLGPNELAELKREGEPLQMNCDYCGTEYEVSLDELSALLRRATAS